MKIELNEQEKDIFIRMAYIGNRIIQDSNMADEEKQKYTALSDMISSEYINSLQVMPEQELSEDDLYEKLLDEMMPLLENYEEQMIPYTLARMLADFIYPVESVLDFAEDRNIIAQSIYEQELSEKGMAIVRLDIPEFEKRVEAAFISERVRNIDILTERLCRELLN